MNQCVYSQEMIQYLMGTYEQALSLESGAETAVEWTWENGKMVEMC